MLPSGLVTQGPKNYACLGSRGTKSAPGRITPGRNGFSLSLQKYLYASRLSIAALGSCTLRRFHQPFSARSADVSSSPPSTHRSRTEWGLLEWTSGVSDVRGITRHLHVVTVDIRRARVCLW